jgi:hypothetical protein
VSEINKSQVVGDILDKVGAKLDIEITDTSTPTAQQVVVWLNDAALMIVRLLPEERLGLLRTSISSDDISGVISITEPVEKIVSARKYGIECTKLKQREMDLVSTRMPLVHTTRNPAYCISGSGGSVQLQFWPESSGPVLVKAIRKPEAYSMAPGWTAGSYTLPVELEMLAVDYAVLQGKIQDEEVQQAQILMQAWFQQAGIEGQVEGLGVQS